MKPEYLNAWGYFVAETAHRLNKWRTPSGSEIDVLGAIEIANEPNVYNEVGGRTIPAGTNHLCNLAPTTEQYFNDWSMSYEDFADLVTYAYSWIDQYKQKDKISSDKRLIAGGLYVNWEADGADPVYGRRFRNGLTDPNSQDPTSGLEINWCQYLIGFEGAVCAQYDVGIHPYDLALPYPSNSATAGNRISSRVLSIVDQALYVTNKDIWITETGAPSNSPLTQTGQDLALRQISQGMTSRPRCRGLIVHSFYEGELPSNQFHSFGVVDNSSSPPASSPKLAYTSLSSEWDN